MRVANQVRTSIERLAPEPAGEHCVAERLARSLWQYAGHKVRVLLDPGGFEHREEAGAPCGATKMGARRAR